MKISIIVPIYNVSDYIADCLQSVLNQTYSDLEIVLVNDATPDNSMEEAQPWIEMLQKYYEVKVVNHDYNRGLSAARNTGMEVATADWIYFLDSDDEITPNCIELLVTQVKKYPDVDFVIGGVKTIGTNWNYPLTCASYVKGTRNILQDYIANKWYVMAWNHLYRKKYLLQHALSFKEGLLHEDELFSFQIATTARAIAAVYEETYIYKVRSSGSITAQRKLKNFEDLLFIIREKYTYILKQYQVGIHVIPFTYSLETLYVYAVLLAKSKLIGIQDKVRLLSGAKKAFASLSPYKIGSWNLKYELLIWLFKMPSRLILLIVKWRLSVVEEKR